MVPPLLGTRGPARSVCAPGPTPWGQVGPPTHVAGSRKQAGENPTFAFFPLALLQVSGTLGVRERPGIFFLAVLFLHLWNFSKRLGDFLQFYCDITDNIAIYSLQVCNIMI